MEFHPYGPIEEAVNRSVSPDAPSATKNTKFWWGVLAATVVYGFVAWLTSADYKLIRRDQIQKLPPENQE